MLSDHSRAHELGPLLRFCGVVGSISAGLLCVGLLCAFRHGGFLLNMFSGNRDGERLGDRDCCTRRARNPRRLAAVGTCGGTIFLIGFGRACCRSAGTRDGKSGTAAGIAADFALELNCGGCRPIYHSVHGHNYIGA